MLGELGVMGHSESHPSHVPSCHIDVDVAWKLKGTAGCQAQLCSSLPMQGCGVQEDCAIFPWHQMGLGRWIQVKFDCDWVHKWNDMLKCVFIIYHRIILHVYV